MRLLQRCMRPRQLNDEGNSSGGQTSTRLCINVLGVPPGRRLIKRGIQAAIGAYSEFM
jgi:hypothetical protein